MTPRQRTIPRFFRVYRGHLGEGALFLGRFATAKEAVLDLMWSSTALMIIEAVGDRGTWVWGRSHDTAGRFAPTTNLPAPRRFEYRFKKRKIEVPR